MASLWWDFSARKWDSIIQNSFFFPGRQFPSLRTTKGHITKGVQCGRLYNRGSGWHSLPSGGSNGFLTAPFPSHPAHPNSPSSPIQSRPIPSHPIPSLPIQHALVLPPRKSTCQDQPRPAQPASGQGKQLLPLPTPPSHLPPKLPKPADSPSGQDRSSQIPLPFLTPAKGDLMESSGYS